MRHMVLVVSAAMAGTVLATSAFAQPTPPATEVTGLARAINADTIAVGTTYVFLYGLESVERTQKCGLDGRPYDCYDYAVRALETIIDVAPVTCTLMPPPDYLGRYLGTCTVAGVDVNNQLVREGWALAKRDETLDYVPAEDAARAENIGLWPMEFQHPAEHRLVDGITEDRP